MVLSGGHIKYMVDFLNWLWTVVFNIEIPLDGYGWSINKIIKATVVVFLALDLLLLFINNGRIGGDDDGDNVHD